MKKLAVLLAVAVACGLKTQEKPSLNGLWTAGWSSDGKYIAAGGDNGKLVILNSDLSILKTFPFDSMTIASVSWHPRQNLLVFSAYPHNRTLSTQTFQLLNMETGKSIELGKYGGRGLSWSSDGERVALGGDGVIYIFSTSGKKIREIKHPSGRSLFSISWHPTKNIIAAADEDVRLFDVETGREILAIHVADVPKAILCVRWHPSGKFFATGDYGHAPEPSYLKFFTEEGQPLQAMTQSNNAYRGMEWSDDGSKLATVSDSLRIWSKSGNLLKTVNNGSGKIWGVDWNKNHIVTGGWENGVIVWSDEGEMIRSYED